MVLKCLRKKLIKLTVKFGEEQRTVVTNIKQYISDPKELENREFLFVTNLKPVLMMGIESTAMILPGEIEKGNGYVTVNGENGSKMLN